MEPKLPSSERRSEVPSFNYGPSREPGAMETGSEPARAEKYSGETEQAPVRQSVLPPPVLPVPPQVQPVSDDDVQAKSVSNDLPAIAGDEDLIEKEWVEKAKKIIVETKDDPYRREQEVARLQVDYLRKRYGREIGVADNT